jgi:hypothetical protein
MKPSLVSVVLQQASYDPRLVRSSVIASVGQLVLSWSEIVRPGDRVLLKPNFIQESHTERPDEGKQVIKHYSGIEKATCPARCTGHSPPAGANRRHACDVTHADSIDFGS